MPKHLIFLMFLPIIATAKPNDNPLIGKWQCTAKNGDVVQASELRFLADGTMNETIYERKGNKTAYDHQIITTQATAQWSFENDTLIYHHYKINGYKVRMPNAKKDDLDQAEIAAQKTLPVLQQMIANGSDSRLFNLDFANKRQFLANDVQNQAFLDCKKKYF